MKFNKEKFKTLVHYICARCIDPTKLGATKLNKILWYSDITSYRFYGKSITGEIYKKHQFGPVPEHITSVIQELEKDKYIIIREGTFYSRSKKDYISLKNPDISNFTSKEISLIDEFIYTICNDHTAKSISQLTHNEIWELADIGEEIPYYAIWASSLGAVNADDIQWAKK